MEKNLTDEELFEIKRKYGLEVFKNEFIKLVILTALFLALDQLVPFLFAVAVLLPVRIFSGGLHMSGNISCFIFSLCFFMVSIELFPMLDLNMVSVTVFVVCSFVCISLLSLIYFCCFNGYMSLCSVAVGVLTMQAAQLLTANLISKKGGIENEK